MRNEKLSSNLQTIPFRITFLASVSLGTFYPLVSRVQLNVHSLLCALKSQKMEENNQITFCYNVSFILELKDERQKLLELKMKNQKKYHESAALNT